MNYYVYSDFITVVYLLLLYKERCCIWVQWCSKIMQLSICVIQLMFCCNWHFQYNCIHCKKWLFVGKSCSVLNISVSVFFLNFENLCVLCFLQKGFLHFMLPCLLSFKAYTVKPAHPKGHFTVSDTILFITGPVDRSQGISVTIVTKPWAGWLWGKVWFLGGGKRFYSSGKCPDWLWGPPNLLFCGFQCLFPQGVKQPKYETDHLRFMLSLVHGGVPPLLHMPSCCGA
jgi:hypothetical protein